MLTFNTDGMVLQCFAFKAPLMDYFFKNLKPEHLIKLYQCCKFFYAKFHINIIRDLFIIDDNVPEILYPTVTVIHASNTALKKLADFWISDSFNSFYNVHITLPTFSRCTIKKLVLSGTIKELKIKGVFADDGVAFIPIQDIIIEVPNAKTIKIYESFITPTTFSSLISLKHCAKISKLVLKNMTHAILFEDELMADFVLKNADDVCDVLIGFKMVPEIDDLSRQLNFIRNLYSFNFNHFIALLLQRKKDESS
uniref:Uncharacterized protein n=1 Tax=Panagrolaimus sp. PS1159 TaxID=55785 RepID=A0AC35GF92_9BILA